tara:strand:- start:333 stop:467 length:135 start_codon:yes stop_codon:yes gene_type:complete
MIAFGSSNRLKSLKTHSMMKEASLLSLVIGVLSRGTNFEQLRNR